MRTTARVFQINLSRGGVPKLAIREARVGRTGLEGDAVNHPRVHGGPERALCLYSLERILALQEEGHPIFPGAVGENLTLSGLDWEAIQPEVVLAIGAGEEAVHLQITRHTTPCNTIAPYLKEGRFQRLDEGEHPGWSRVYARVLQEGVIRAGDPVRLIPVHPE